MSNQVNTSLAEDLFERLESFKGVLNIYEYGDKVRDLVSYLADGDLEGAQSMVRLVEERYYGELKDSEEDEPEPLETDVY